MWTIKIAFVRLLIFFLFHLVVYTTCQDHNQLKRLPPASITAKAQEIIVNEGIITSSPDFKLSDLRATISAAVPLVTETAYFLLQYFAHFFSNVSKYEPDDEIHSVCMQSKTYSFVLFDNFGSETLIIF